MANHAWLPALICLADHDGDWGAYVDAIYAKFREDFIDSRPRFRGAALGMKRLPLRDGREATFWHLTSQGDGPEDERVLHEPRCERIGWPRPSVENEADAAVKVWEEPRGSEFRVHIWVEADDYVVVLVRRKVGQPDEYILPWTAFVVESGHYRRNLQRRFEQFG